MKKTLLVALLLLSVFARSVSAGGNELKIFIWSEYMDEYKMRQQFKAATGINAKIDVYENNEEMLAKLMAGGVSEYDIIVPSDYVIPSLIRNKLIQPLNKAKIPNLKNIMPMFAKTTYDPGGDYTAAYQWGTVGLMYNKKKISDADAKSWSVLFDPKKQKGTFWLMDSVRDTMSMANMYQGFEMNTTNPSQIKKSAELLVQVKHSRYCRGFKPGVGAKNDVDAGQSDLAIVYNGDAMRAVVGDRKRLGFAIPKEGGEIWCDFMAIPARAPNLENAYKWINFVLDPKIGAQVSNYNRYATPNQASLKYIIPMDLKSDEIYPSPETMKRLHYTKDLGSVNKIVDEAWTSIKSH